MLEELVERLWVVQRESESDQKRIECWKRLVAGFRSPFDGVKAIRKGLSAGRFERALSLCADAKVKAIRKGLSAGRKIPVHHLK